LKRLRLLANENPRPELKPEKRLRLQKKPPQLRKELSRRPLH
jgi:hypothetical protein